MMAPAMDSCVRWRLAAFPLGIRKERMNWEIGDHTVWCAIIVAISATDSAQRKYCSGVSVNVHRKA